MSMQNVKDFFHRAWHFVLKYLINNFIAVDRLCNSLLFGDRDMTLSGRMGKAIAEGRCSACKPVCWLLNKISKDHCRRVGAREASEGNDELIGL